MTPWYTSKQFWFNALTVIVAVAAAFGFREFTPDPRAAVIAQLLVAIANVALRFAFPSSPPPAGLEQTKAGVWDFQPPARTFRRANITATLIFSALTLSVLAGLAVLR